MNVTEHLLTIAGEEGCEIAQRTSKALRFGVDEVEPGQLLTNKARIVDELHDLCAVLEMLGYVAFDEETAGRLVVDEKAMAMKRAKVRRFLDLSAAQGTLS